MVYPCRRGYTTAKAKGFKALQRRKNSRNLYPQKSFPPFSLCLFSHPGRVRPVLANPPKRYSIFPPALLFYVPPRLQSRLILQVHDELLIETAKDEEEEVKKILEEEMKHNRLSWHFPPVYPKIFLHPGKWQNIAQYILPPLSLKCSNPDKDEEEEVKKILEEEMKAAADLSVTLEIDMHTGQNWYEAK